MKTQSKPSNAESIMQVFRDLGLEDVRTREKFLQLGKSDPWNKSRENPQEQQEIISSTATTA